MNIKIANCHQCPCCDENDMGIDYACRLLSHDEGQIISSEECWHESPPRRCPLRKGVYLKLTNSKYGTRKEMKT